MYKIGLTGGIAAGKSTVLNWLLTHDIATVDADVVARQVVEPHTPGLEAVVAAFGKDIVRNDGTLNREKLGAIVFRDEDKRHQLNTILHTYIYEKMMDLTAEYEAKGYETIIYDIPLLIETGWVTMMDEIWLVYVDYDVQLARLMERNGYTQEQAKARIDSQMPLADKKKYAQVIIDNNSSERDLYEQLNELWRRECHRFVRRK